MSDKNIDKDIEILEDKTVDIDTYNEVLKENIILNAELDETIKELNEKDISISMFKNEVKIYKKAVEELKRKEELYKNCISDMADELVRFSTSCYFRQNEEETIRYFEDKWGLLKNE